MRKRFIAGAICRHCQAKDTLALWKESGVEVVECVNCGDQMREADKQVQSAVRKDEQIIGVFTPE
ncbi:YheV family putative zinc ribbon protein [Tatumella ptyseos]|uniref:YheV family putative zinc ribbon protein n=1 Tax=Tatumella ptyseos TaxID=82987 RepID=UPI0026F25F21|nr:YheV family putative zinc ribbon protein [Tatumella ptyseos]WKX26661.1 YheV family putative zinc ribbon protein [Tatumella ptyseos]